MFVVVANSHLWTRVHGPYSTAASASGAGFGWYGPIVFGAEVKWSVHPIEKERA